ncbi:hypothetical protein FSP39_003902 [Pinctada imbricata]|uniref:Uncharacterized protein n=1 Tax=Pinctada imbricata TaxID=66713 RepID=A0AA89C6E2_PINIB|nr:hypothetical protein FSP39_003902 [Pinctada imbricata]
MVELLLNYVEEIPPSDAEGRHTIHYAAASGNSKVTAFLLDRKPELVNILDSFEYTPLHVAMSRGNVYLERNIAVPALFSSALLMDGFIMKLMYSVDKRNVRTPTYKDGVCHMDVVRLLLKYGADMTCTSADGTPEAIAASYGLQNMIQAMEI